MTRWRRYVDNTIAFVKEEEIENVLRKLNEFHEDIKFTHEVEQNRKIPFLDVLVQRKENNEVDLNVYRKKTCSNIYIHWKSFAPTNWKIGTLEGMIHRAYIICTDKDDLNSELSFITDVFKSINEYPMRIISNRQDKLKKMFNEHYEHNDY